MGRLTGHVPRRKLIGTVLACTVVVSPAWWATGFGNGFIGLEDYQSDLLFSALAYHLLQDIASQAGDGDQGTGQPAPGPEGPPGRRDHRVNPVRWVRKVKRARPC